MTSQQCRDSRHAAPVRDAGFTLPELLIAIIISGILIVSISMAFSTILQTQSSATDLLAESKDITFVQTWIPVDLSSAVASSDEADEAKLAAELLAAKPPVSISAVLPGTNVLTVIRPDLETNPVTYYVVAYRYEKVGNEWQISRYEIKKPGQGANEVVKTVGVAHEVPPPPANGSWQPGTGQKPKHAASVTARTQFIRPVGEDVTIEFQSGSEYKSGGGGLSAQNQLPENNSGGLIDPTSPPSRCGKRIAIVLDTSGSVPAGSGGVNLETAAVGFIDAFTGTPSSISINGFDREGYGMLTPGTAGYPTINGTRAPYVSVLNTGPSVTAIKKRITDLDNRDGAWDQNNPDAPLFDGIHWDQIGSGTNWEDGFWNILKQSNGTPYGVDQPELIVFITDGQPNYVRTAAGGFLSTTEDAAKNAAKDQADIATRSGARVVGVMVGNAINTQKYVNYLGEVVGSGFTGTKGQSNYKAVVWDGSTAGASTAALFTTQFAQVGNALRSIAIAECGGTVTVQKRMIDGSTPTTGAWTYSTSTGNNATVLDTSETRSVTFDYRFPTGQTSRTEYVFESGGYGVFDHAECTANGVTVPNTKQTVDPKTGLAASGISVTVAADTAVSCVMFSRPS
jgi:prepilin-type N-terminal cleavage/methylation domain-containing protein